ncbi:MAG: hypothetical protein IPJ77_00560 [Planctomycetes bacterium]|nr:hypothetical protein [Planctomycetota bacterium]
MNRLAAAVWLSALLAVDARAAAHGVYQEFVRKSSGRPVDCAMCHTHSNGPEGTAAGQIGGLSSEELSRLGRARSAFEPGANVDSPILNDFGDLILQRVGKKRVLELRSAPGRLVEELGVASDLDADGLSDAREYLEGTHPLIASDGDPWSLFCHSVKREWFRLVMITAATLITLYGLSNLLRGFAVRVRAKESAEEGAGS